MRVERPIETGEQILWGQGEMHLRVIAERLTDREEEVLRTIARGLTNEEIAAELHVSLSTVKTHVANVMGKIGARNRVEIAVWAYETGRV